MAPPPSTPTKAPPTGPKALRAPNGPSASRPPAPNGALPGKVSITFPSGSNARPPPSGPRSNGFSMALPAESSRQAAGRPPPPPQEPPPPPRSPSPPKRRKSPSPTKREEEAFKSSIRPVEELQRAKISISFGVPDGRSRPLPPHQSLEPSRASASPTALFFPGADPPISPKSERRAVETSSSSSNSRAYVRPPSSPKRRPGLLGRRPATPPPPPDSAPPPPPQSPRSTPRSSPKPGRPPPPSNQAPPPPASPPLPEPPSVTPPTLPRVTRPRSPPRETAPPAFHFRDLPDKSESAAPPSFHFRELARHEASEDGASESSRASSPEPVKAEVKPEIEEYVSPASAFRRVNSGSFYVVGGPTKLRSGKSGEAKRNPAAYTRYDGVERDGSVVTPIDPRLKSSAWKRGVGPAAQVSKFYQISYQWDEATSVGPKPPDPPTAVLITGLSPLTTADQIRKFLAPHGRIRDLDVKMDKKSGSQLGICWVKFDASHRGVSAHEVAKTVCKVCDGQRISLMAEEKIRVVLDGRGLRAEKAVKEEMERKYAPKPKPQVIPTPPPPVGGQTPSLPVRPPPPKPTPIPFHRNAPPPPRQWQRSILPPRPATQQLSSSFTDRPFAPRSNRFERDTWRRRDDSTSSYSSRSRSRSRGRYSDYSSDSDYDRRRRSPLRLLQKEEVKDQEEAVESALKENGHPALFIDIQSLPMTANNEGPLHDHFKHFKPSRILRSSRGWYILFADDTSAGLAKTMLENTRINGRKISIALKDQANKSGAVVAAGDKRWRFLSFGKKNKAPPVKPLVKPRPVRIVSSSPESDAPPPKPPVTAVEKVEPQPEPQPEPDVVQVETERKRKAKPVAAKGAKKARIETVELPAVVEPEVAEIKIDEKIEPEPKAKPKKAPQTPLDKLIADGVIEDEEDVYWLGVVLKEQTEEEEEEEEVLLPEDHPLHHLSGSWRAEGFKQIPKTQKSNYLPQRNRAQASAEEAGALTTGRTARITGRRLVQDMDTHRKTTAAASESDLFAFNQLRIRKKQLKFARSAIEGYGLYAMETIQTGEMVCEYVGELVRSSVADLREHQYLKQGIGSSYLFRIDGDVVCDATFRGSVSRLINHSCDPSATAKIISINGQSKIVIYAKRMLHPGEEILYDYKFPLESDPALRVPCLCGAATCRGWLN